MFAKYYPRNVTNPIKRSGSLLELKGPEFFAKGPLLGEGTFGEVHLFESLTNTNSKKAVKSEKPTLNFPKGENYTRGKQFLAESEMLRLDNRTGIMLGDPNQTNAPHHLVMDYEEGMTLRSLARTPLSAITILDIFRLILIQLKQLHDAGLIHQDLSLDNILVKIEGGTNIRVKIIDFGHVRRQNTPAHHFFISDLAWSIMSDEQRDAVGNYERYAPELKKEEKSLAEPSQDIYSLGIALQKFCATANIYNLWKNPIYSICGLMCQAQTRDRISVENAMFCFKQLHEQNSKFTEFLRWFEKYNNELQSELVRAIKPYINNFYLVYVLLWQISSESRYKFLAHLGKDFLQKEIIQNGYKFQHILWILPESDKLKFINFLGLNFIYSHLPQNELMANLNMKQCLDLMLPAEEKRTASPLRQLKDLLIHFAEKPNELLKELGFKRFHKIVNSSAEMKELLNEFPDPESQRFLAKSIAQMVIASTQIKDSKNENACAEALRRLEIYSACTGFHKMLLGELLEWYRADTHLKKNNHYFGIEFFNKDNVAKLKAVQAIYDYQQQKANQGSQAGTDINLMQRIHAEAFRDPNFACIAERIFKSFGV